MAAESIFNSRASDSGPVGKGTCQQARQPELNPWNPRGGRSVPTGCPLTSTHVFTSRGVSGMLIFFCC